VTKSSAFPIRLKRHKDKHHQPVPTEKWNEIRRLGWRERRAIEWLQPYNARKDKLAATRTHLADIHRLDIADKQRHLHFVQMALSSVPVPNTCRPSSASNLTRSLACRWNPTRALIAGHS
jgi:hypothetical protein